MGLRLYVAGFLATAVIAVPPTASFAQNTDPAPKPAESKPVDAAKANELQKGEPVLAIEASAADAPRCREPGDPWVEIVDVRQGADAQQAGGIRFGPSGNMMAIRYRFIEQKPDLVNFIVKTGTGRAVITLNKQQINITSSGFRGGFSYSSQPRDIDQQGTREISFSCEDTRAEIWVEYDPAAKWPPGYANQGPAIIGRKISKSFVLGPVGQLTLPREWTAAEKKAAEEDRLRLAPPPPAPAGFVVVDSKTSPLIPGMPLLVANRGKWHETELLAVGEGKLVARVPDVDVRRAGNTLHALDRCAIATAVLERGKTEPTAFKPTLKVFAHTGSVLPPTCEILTPDIKLVPGTPLHSSGSGLSRFVAMAPDGQVIVRDDQTYGTLRKRTAPMNNFALASEDRQRLTEAGAEEFYKAQADAILAAADKEADLREAADELRNRRQRASLPGQVQPNENPPPGVVPLTDGLFIPAGLPVVGRLYSEWKCGQAIEESPFGRIEIRFDQSSEDKRTARKDLYISPEALRELQKGPTKPDDAIRTYDFAIESTAANFKVSQALRESFGLTNIEAMPFTMGPHKLALTQKLTRAKARTAEYRLLAAGAQVSVLETELPAN